MRQCVMSREKQIFTSWLPCKFAVKGKILKFKNADGTWDDSWEVSEVHGSRTVKECRERSQDYKKQRQASDI